MKLLHAEAGELSGGHAPFRDEASPDPEDAKEGGVADEVGRPEEPPLEDGDFLGEDVGLCVCITLIRPGCCVMYVTWERTCSMTDE